MRWKSPWSRKSSRDSQSSTTSRPSSGDDRITPATLGLSIAEGKAVMGRNPINLGEVDASGQMMQWRAHVKSLPLVSRCRAAAQEGAW
jgi:hypothetical protein